MKFKDKTVLITGGCSGIGKIMARKAIERGCKKLIIWDIDEVGLLATKKDFQNASTEIYIYKIDVDNREEIMKQSQFVHREVGIVDILINNAGIIVGKYFHEHSHSEIAKSMSINAEAYMHIALQFLPGMVTQNGGAICNIASSAGLISNPKMSVYAASKWAVVGWSDSLRLELKQLQKNIAVITIMPFFINTGMFDGVKSKLLPILDAEKTSERIIKAIENERKLLAMPLPYWFIRLSQGLLPLPVFEWVMQNIFGIYDTMSGFTGRKKP